MAQFAKEYVQTLFCTKKIYLYEMKNIFTMQNLIYFIILVGRKYVGCIELLFKVYRAICRF